MIGATVRLALVRPAGQPGEFYIGLPCRAVVAAVSKARSSTKLSQGSVVACRRGTLRCNLVRIWLLQVLLKAIKPKERPVATENKRTTQNKQRRLVEVLKFDA